MDTSILSACLRVVSQVERQDCSPMEGRQEGLLFSASLGPRFTELGAENLEPALSEVQI